MSDSSSASECSPPSSPSLQEESYRKEVLRIVSRSGSFIEKKMALSLLNTTTKPPTEEEESPSEDAAHSTSSSENVATASEESGDDSTTENDKEDREETLHGTWKVATTWFLSIFSSIVAHILALKEPASQHLLSAIAWIMSGPTMALQHAQSHIDRIHRDAEIQYLDGERVSTPQLFMHMIKIGLNSSLSMLSNANVPACIIALMMRIFHVLYNVTQMAIALASQVALKVYHTIRASFFQASTMGSVKAVVVNERTVQITQKIKETYQQKMEKYHATMMQYIQSTWAILSDYIFFIATTILPPPQMIGEKTHQKLMDYINRLCVNDAPPKASIAATITADVM